MDDPEAIHDALAERGWSDGLPLVPPTPERVARMLGSWAERGAEVVGPVLPSNRLATLGSIAANCVMAGCRPEYLPVVVAALRGMLDERFNLRGVQPTTHPAAPLVIVNGPIRQRIGLNGGHGCFGPGWRANATIGRALRLILLTIGGARPGVEDKSTQGSPAKYSYCLAENEEASPWEPLHVERGFERTQSTVTVVAAEPPHNVNGGQSAEAENILETMASAMISLASNDAYLGIGRHHPVVALCPEHAEILRAAGYTRRDVQHDLFARSRSSLKRLKRGGLYNDRDWPAGFDTDDEETLLPIVSQPDDLIVIVAGGAGRHSSYIPAFGWTSSVTVPIEE
ncbi:MAG: hypothetical protein IT307_11925 [Chloroflexi bacterium]|nr:hypothetical protein [Chloroflexota bacterium]